MAIDSKTDTKEFETYLEALYRVTDIPDEELQSWYDAVRYKGFNRLNVLRELKVRVPDIKAAQEIILCCGLLGPKRAVAAKLYNGRTVGSYGIPASGLKGKEGLSCQRIVAATADLCASFLKKLEVPKRINVDCPAWLQFPSAGSIKMDEPMRALHREFMTKFSTLIGGAFNDQIYDQMILNAYLDERLNLFGDDIIIDQVPKKKPPRVVASSVKPAAAAAVASIKPEEPP